jgi:hypothetical protein
MNRSTLCSVSIVLASAVVSLWPLGAGAQEAPTVSVTTNQIRNVDIVYGDGDEGPISVGPVTATPHQTRVALAPGDVVYGNADEGAIDAGPAPAVLVATHDKAPSPHAGHDLLFGDDDMGGAPVDLSAFAGRSNVSATELATGRPDISQDLAEFAQQF